MILYHGTNQNRGNKILLDGVIKCDIERFYGEMYDPILQTTNEYIYLTNSLTLATYYGNKHSYSSNEEYFYVFKVKLPQDVLIPDLDELRMVYGLDVKNNIYIASESLEICNSVAFPDDLPFNKYDIQYVKMLSTWNRNLPEIYYDFIYTFIKLRGKEINENLSEAQHEIINNTFRFFNNNFQWCSCF